MRKVIRTSVHSAFIQTIDWFKVQTFIERSRGILSFLLLLIISQRFFFQFLRYSAHLDTFDGHALLQATFESTGFTPIACLQINNTTITEETAIRDSLSDAAFEETLRK